MSTFDDREPVRRETVDPAGGARADSYEPVETVAPDAPVAERREAVSERRDPVTERRVPVAQAGAPVAETDVPVVADATDRRAVVAREKEAFGGFKFGSAFFGWLTATGTAVLLTALVAATGAAVGFGANASKASTERTVGLTGAIVLVVILFISYLAGGYVAGRMARFSGAKQGLAVWLWALVIAIVVAVIGVIAGSQWNVLANLNSFPRLPFGQGQMTVVGIITAAALLVASLIGAILGGLAGMRYHRKVDRAGLGE